MPCTLPLHKDLWQCLSGIQGGFFHNGWAAIFDEEDESPKVYAGNPKACGSLWICGGEAGRRWWEQSGVNMSTREVAMCQLDSSTPLTLAFWDILELQGSFYAFTLLFFLYNSQLSGHQIQDHHRSKLSSHKIKIDLWTSSASKLFLPTGSSFASAGKYFGRKRKA